MDKTKEQLLRDLIDNSDNEKRVYLNELSLIDKDLLTFFTSEPYPEVHLGYPALLQILKELKNISKSIRNICENCKNNSNNCCDSQNNIKE